MQAPYSTLPYDMALDLKAHTELNRKQPRVYKIVYPFIKEERRC
jgi:hypothetical protein